MTRFQIFALSLCLLALPATGAFAHKAKKSAEVFIANLEDGAVTTSPLHLEFGARNIDIAPVGINVHRSGHHHLLINIDEPASMDDVIPFDNNHLHYMNGETEAVIELPPGKHTLQLVLGDEEHQPWGEHLISERITIIVVDEPSASQ